MTSTTFARLAFASATLLAALQIMGCTTSMTDEAEYEAKARHAERIDEIRAFIAACHGAEMVVVYYGPTTNKLRDPIRHVPRHAHPTDYACASEHDIRREMLIGG